MSAELPLHKAIIDKLRADPGLTALLAAHGYIPGASAVYDYAPHPTKPEDAVAFPYVVVGDTTAVEFDTDDLDGQEFTVALHIWDHYRGTKRVREVSDAIYLALHRATLAVEGQDFIYCFYEFSGVVPDPDMLVHHSVTRFRIVTQKQ